MISLDLTYDKSTLVQLMAWCRWKGGLYLYRQMVLLCRDELMIENI